MFCHETSRNACSDTSPLFSLRTLCLSPHASTRSLTIYPRTLRIILGRPSYYSGSVTTLRSISVLLLGQPLTPRPLVEIRSVKNRSWQSCYLCSVTTHCPWNSGRGGKNGGNILQTAWPRLVTRLGLCGVTRAWPYVAVRRCYGTRIGKKNQHTVEYSKMHINGTSQKFMHCVNYAETNVTYLWH